MAAESGGGRLLLDFFSFFDKAGTVAPFPGGNTSPAAINTGHFGEGKNVKSGDGTIKREENLSIRRRIRERRGEGALTRADDV